MTTAEKVAIPSAPGISDNADAIISIRNLRKWYQVGGGFLGFGNKIWLMGGGFTSSNSITHTLYNDVWSK